MAKVFVKFRKARPFWFGHPWVFSGAIDRVKGTPEDGDVVELCDHGGHPIGEGFWNSRSQIQVRLVALISEGRLDKDLLLGRIDRAVAMRCELQRLDAMTNAFRVIHSEGDGLPGLVADFIAGHLVVQVSSLGIARFVDDLVARLVERLKPLSVTERTSRVATDEEGLVRNEAVLHGNPPESPVQVIEHGVRFWCDLRGGQKTGFYCDQRDNRRALLPYVNNRDVLDAFSYVGGFGLPALVHGGAKSVHFLDSSEPAIAFARQGAESNGVADRATFEEANVLRALDHYAKDGRKFDVVVLDPPKFVHRRNDLTKGLRLYFEVNQKALRVLRDGGILVTCSCSQHVSESDFEDVLANVAKEGYARLQLLHRGSQSADHPMMLPHAESRYLKAHIYRVHQPPAGFVPPIQPGGLPHHGE